MSSQVLAILWVQWRCLLVLRPGERFLGRILVTGVTVLWYGLWTSLAAGLAALVSNPTRRTLLELALPWALLLVAVYWQLAPLLTASLGAALNLNKLLIYPIPERRLFLIEVLLRLTTGLEMLLILAGLSVGLLLNPAVSHPTVLVAIPVFVLFNLLLAAGLRSLLIRLAARKRVREALIFLAVLSAALPQLLSATGVPAFLRRALAHGPLAIWPWTATASLALGQSTAAAWAVLCVWTAAAYLMGRWQFHCSLRFDAAAAEASGRSPGSSGAWTERLYRIPGWFLADPLGALVEKELRSLFRTPQFRLVFVMGFTFGFLIWVPLWHSFRAIQSPPLQDFPVLVSAYALLLLSEAVFWNIFGFDRSAAQLYFAAPVPFAKVLTGKNLAAVLVVMLEVTLVGLVCLLLRLPVPGVKILEAYAVVLVFCLYLLAVGNFSSLYWPRAVDPRQTWGAASSGRSRALMTLLFPALALPLLPAYLARYAFDSLLAFYGLLALAALVGAACYWVAADSAVRAADHRQEKLLAALAQGTGPLGN
jgi:ABC-2 type transport system permease protein